MGNLCYINNSCKYTEINFKMKIPYSLTSHLLSFWHFFFFLENLACIKLWSEISDISLSSSIKTSL